jgi:hypothetical protein
MPQACLFAELSLPLVAVVLLALVGHGYFWVAIVNRIHGTASPRYFIDGATLVCLFAFLAMPLLILWNWPEVLERWSTGLGYPAGFSVRYFQFCAAWCVGAFLLKAVTAKERNDPHTFRLWRREPVAGVADSGAAMFHGVYPQLLARIPGNQILDLQVEHKRLAIPRLHAKHAGLTIAHVSDFHMTGRVDRRWFKTVVREVNRLQADVIAITGDIVEHADCVPWLADTVCQFQARLGVYFILGNHDRYVGLDPTRDKLVDARHICLSGRWLVDQWNGAPVLLAGNERPWFREVGNLEEAPPRDADNLPLRLFLLHTPDQIGWARRHDADLVLAGHTHGGQICIPLLGAVACPSLHGTRYSDGVYREGLAVMHVTRGLSARTPLRWNCPPEIALLELVTA